MIKLVYTPKIFFLAILVLWLGQRSYAATFTASATGNWSAAATWTNANVNRTGTVSCSTVSTAVVGTGTLFTTELSVGSVIQRQNGTTIGIVASISDNTNLTLTGNAANTTSGSYRISDGPGGAIDDVKINSGFTVTVNIANTLCNTITTINTGGITISGTNSLTVTGLISMARPSSNNTNFTIAVGAGTLTAGSLTMSSTTLTKNNIISISTGAVTINGTVTTGTTGCQFNFTGAGILDFHGTFTSSPTITTFAGSTVIYSNAGVQTVRATTYRNLTLSGTSAKTTTGAIVSGILSIEGTASISGTAPTWTGTAYTLQYKTTDAHTATAEWITPFAGSGGVIIANTAGSVTMNSAETFGTGVPLTIDAGATLNSSTYSNTFSSTSVVTINGTFQTANTAGFSGTTSTAIKSTNSPTITLGGNSTIEYTVAGGGQTVTGRTYDNLTLDNASGINPAGGAITVGGTLTTTAGGTLNMVTYQLLGALTAVSNAGTIRTQCLTNPPIPTGETWGGTVQYDALGGTQTVMAGTYNNLTLSNTGGAQSASGALTVNGTLTTTAGGSLNMVTYQLLGGLSLVTNNGTIRTQCLTNPPIPTGETWGGTVQYDALGGTQTVMAGTYNNLTLSNTGGTQSASGALTVNGTLTTTAGGTLDMVTNQLLGTLTAVTNGGTIQTQNISATPIPSGKTFGGTVLYDGLAQTIATETYNNLIMSGSGIKTLAAAIPTVGGALTVKAGTTLALGTNPLGGTTAPTSIIMEIGTIGSTISGTGVGVLHLGGDVTVNNITGTSGATISCPINLDGNRTFTVADEGTTSADLTISGIVATSFGLTKAGTGTMILSGTNTYTGTTQVSEGVLNLQNSLATGTTAVGVTVSDGATLELEGGIAIGNEALSLSGNGVGGTSGGALFNVSGNNSWAGPITLNAATRINSFSGTLTISGNINMQGFPLIIQGASTNNNTISGVISGTAGGYLNKAGTGTWSLSNTNTFIGGVLFYNGTLNINNAQALGTVAGTFTIGLPGNSVILNNTSGSAITTLNYPMAWNGDFTFTGTNDLNLGTGTVTLNASRQASVSSGTLTLGGTVSGSSYGLTKAGAGTLKFGANAVTLHDLTISSGAFTSTSGILNLSGTIENTGTFIHNNGTVNFNGSIAQTIPLLNYYSISATNAAGVSLTGNTTLNGTLTLANGALTVGANTLTFQNSNTPISRSAGTLTVTDNSNLVFGTSGNTGGSAFTIPNSTFTSSPSLNNLTINRTNSLTWNNQMLSLKGILLCSNGTFNTNGKLTLLSTATQTALIDGAGSGSVTGNVSMQQYIASGFGYKYISSPFEAATVNELSDDLDLAATFATVYAYDEDNHSDSLGVARDATGWTKYITPSGILTPMKGFAANLGAMTATKTIDITGVVNNGLSSPLTLYNHNRQYTKGFNLVGNPYPSPIDWNAGIGWTKTNIDNAVYYFDAGVSSQYTGTYSSYANGVSSNGTAGNIIPAMQGFFVHVTNGLYPVTASLGMGNQVRVNNLNSVFHKSADTEVKPLVRLTAEYDTEKIKDAAVVYFDELATTIFDKEFDALKLMNTDQGVPNLYSVTTETDRLSISAIPYPADSTTRIPLGLKTEKADWVTLNVTNIENIPSGLHIYLEDALTGLVQDMQINPEYRVHIEKGTLDSRFTLIFSDKDLVHAPTGTDTFFATLINGRLSVTLDANSGNQSQLMISNMPGQVMHRENLYGSGAHEINTQLPAGIYVLTIYGQKGICSQKIYIPN